MSEAKLRSRVPKFGDWDTDELPYTTYFENARKEKAGIKMNPNPNDPEENPEEFMYRRGGLESNYDCQPVPVPFAVYSSKSDSDGKHHPNGANRNVSYDHQKSARRQRNRAPKSPSENSTRSDRSIQHSNHRCANSGQKNGRPGGNSFSASVSNKHHRTASVPKFGEWDETDPTSGEGFTVIFNQVKEEKEAPSSSNFPTVAPEVKTSNYSDCHHSKCSTPSWGSKSKICCCLFSRGSK